MVGTNSGLVENSGASGNVHATWGNSGGLLGENHGTVQRSFATGNVSGQHHAGGLVGENGANHAIGTIQNSFATGNVSGTTAVGGLVGRNTARFDGPVFASPRLDEYSPPPCCCYYWQPQPPNPADFIPSIIENNYATGSVSGENLVGGVVGENSGKISSSAALSPNITGTGADIGRIWGGYNIEGGWGIPGEGENNRAAAATRVNGVTATGEADNNQGATVDTATLATQNFWRNTMGWDFANAWHWCANLNLPVLRYSFNVPPTGVQNIFRLIIAMFALAAISVVSWSVVLHSKLRRKNNAKKIFVYPRH